MWTTGVSGHPDPAYDIALSNELSFPHVLFFHMQVLGIVGAIVPDLHILAIPAFSGRLTTVPSAVAIMGVPNGAA